LKVLAILPVTVPTDRIAAIARVFTADVAGAEPARFVGFREKPKAPFAYAINLMHGANGGCVFWF
jgi:hypothetical protein